MKNIDNTSTNPLVPVICRLGLMNQDLIHRSLNLGLLREAKELKQLDRQLSAMLAFKAHRFDFVGEIAGGSVLLVGEGNLSFTQSLTRKKRIDPRSLTATIFEKHSALATETVLRANKLKQLGVNVLHGVNAARLSDSLGLRNFYTIIFQFPHTGSREPINGRNPNFVLLCQFLKSAKHHLHSNGKVLVTLVNSPHYQGAFQCEEAAKKAGFKLPDVYPFDPADFPGYEHSMTHEDGSALEQHRQFSTWVFRR